MLASVYRRLSSLVGEDAPEGGSQQKPDGGATLWGQRMGEVLRVGGAIGGQAKKASSSVGKEPVPLRKLVSK
jgi:hypothetical protein